MISKIPHRNSKIIVVLGSYEYLERLEGKIRKCLFLYVEILKNNSVLRLARKVLLSSTITQRTKCKCIVQAMPTIKWPDYVKEEDITLENL
jgi:hypothetical protein